MVGCVVLVRYITNCNHRKRWRFVGTLRNGVEWAVKKAYNNESHQSHIWDWFKEWIKCGIEFFFGVSTITIFIILGSS